MKQFASFLLVFGSVSLPFLAAQKKVSVSGSLGATTEFYHFESADSTLRPRRPDFNYRFSFAPIVRIGNGFEMPFEFSLSKPFEQAYLPLASFESPIRNFTNPNNNVGFHPTMKWAKFHVGSHTCQFSELSTGNLPLFGAGFDLNPKRFRLAYSYGVSQWAIRPDTTLGLDGSWERHFQAGKIGWGKKDGSNISLNGAKIRDYRSSLDALLPSTTAQEGLLTTVDFRLRLSSRLVFSGEAGGSAFTKNVRSEAVDTGFLRKIPDFIFRPTQSSRADMAAKAAFDLELDRWSLSAQAKYLGAGYESIGFGLVETDVLDLTITPRFGLFDRKLLVNASVGQRRDNLSKTKLTTTVRFIANGSATWAVTEKLSLSGNYANFGTRNTVDNDTLRIEFVNQNFGLTPSYRWQKGAARHTVSATFSKSVFDDKNLISGDFNSNDVTAASTNWTLVQGRFSLASLASFTRNERTAGRIDLQNYSITPTLTFFNKKMKVALGGLYSIVGQKGGTDDRRLMIKPLFQWKLPKRTVFKADGSWQLYQYGSKRRNSEYVETFLRTAISKTF